MTTAASRIPLVSAISGARVLCVGDIMLDRYVSGEVERISPEAPVPVLAIRSETEMPGGVGNVARNLSGLGAQVTLIASVGDDAAGKTLAAGIDALAKAKAALVVDKKRPTALKTRYVAGNQQIMRADREVVGAFDAKVGAAIVKAAKKALAKHDALVLSDYGKGVLADGRAAELIKAARAAKKPVIVDPKGSDYSIYAGADLVTPNRKELAEASGCKTATIQDATDAAAALRKSCKFGAVLATLSGDGMALVTAKRGLHVAAEAREVFDVSGAGDTVVATVAAALAAGGSLEDAVRLANAAAGIVVGKTGTAVAYADELRTELGGRNGEPGRKTAATFDAAADRVRTWRDRGERVGFTNGCFDLLHPGHVSLLAFAKSTCDRLVVGLNSDASVKRLKGERRPMQNEAARAAVLGSLETVDLVVIFEDDTPENLIRTLRPDVLVKGADYRIDQVVGGDYVQSYGGKVVLAEIVPGFSTTATIARMNAS